MPWSTQRHVEPSFVDPEEHIKRLSGSTDMFLFSRAETMWKTKLSESMQEAGTTHGGGLYSSIRKHGVKKPIHVWINERDQLIQHEGHHRLIAAAHLQRTTGVPHPVPVEYPKPWLGGLPFSEHRMGKGTAATTGTRLNRALDET